MKLNFRRPVREEPEINLIPFIDVLLVILIFLMLTTTYNRFTEMQLQLPQANADPTRGRPREIVVAISADGSYAVNRNLLDGRSVESIVMALERAAGTNKDAALIISADASARHQAVITVMEAARRAGLTQITFATQSPDPGNGH